MIITNAIAKSMYNDYSNKNTKLSRDVKNKKII